MSAHVLNTEQVGPLQLPMFMRAQDIVSSLTGTLDTSYDHPDDVMERKLKKSKLSKRRDPMTGRVAHGTGVYKSVEKHGVLNPVQLVHTEGGGLMMGQGHHRTAAAADIAAQSEGKREMWTPVVHTDAREGSDFPVNAYSSALSKTMANQDYSEWSQNTPSWGHTVGWKEP